MTNIDRLVVKIHTADHGGAGTDGDIFLGIGGREFCIDSKLDDFERASDRTYGLRSIGPGEVAVVNAVDNDPRGPYSINDIKIDHHPVYVRFEPEDRADEWVIQYVSVKSLDKNNRVVRFHEALAPEDDTKIYLSLGAKSGKCLHLEVPFEGRPD
jgi:hypothetical protein